MKKRFFGLTFTIMFLLSSFGLLVGCQPNVPPTNNGNANVISSQLLNGKIANFMQATALGIKDKTEEETFKIIINERSAI